jgi:phosphatidylglycerophosphate synthase
MSSEYKYHVVEQSLLQGTLNKFIWTPIVNHLPARLKPNTITVCGTVFMAIGTCFIWLALSYQMRWGFLIGALGIFLYMAADNVDGPHARKTGQSSRLGEFLDHWLDSICSVMINLCVVFSLGLSDIWLLMGCLTAVAIAFFATIWEHHHTGVFYSGRLGTNEGLILIIGLFVLLFFFHKTWWFKYHGPATINVATGLAYLTIVACTITTLTIVWRAQGHRLEFIPFLLALIAIWIYGGLTRNLLMAGLLILGVNVPFCGRFLLDRLAGQKSRYRSWVIVLFALVVIVMGALAAISEVVAIENPAFREEWRHYARRTDGLIYPALSMLLFVMIWDAFRAVCYLGGAKSTTATASSSSTQGEGKTPQ